MRISHKIFASAFGLAAMALPSLAFSANCGVNNGNDSGAGSLRDCIAAANNGDTVIIPAGTTVNLTSGEIQIVMDITIQGAGIGSSVIQSDGSDRIFEIGDPSVDPDDLANVTLNGVTLTGGAASDGGGVYVHPSCFLNLIDSEITDNDASSSGGGIFNDYGTVLLQNSKVNANTSDGDGTGIYSSYGVLQITQNSQVNSNTNLTTGGNYGGGIYNDSGTLEILDSTVSSNQMLDGNGGGIYSYESSVSIVNSQVNGNTIGNDGYGGGIYNEYSSTVIDNSEVNGNSATGTSSYGGGIYNYYGLAHLVNGSQVSNNSVGGDGAGIYNDEYASLVVENTTIDGNTNVDGSGGGIYNNYWFSMSNSTVSNNSTTDVSDDGDGYGAGLYDCGYAGTVKSSTISGNNGEYGAGVYACNYGSQYTNVTIIGNTAQQDGGGFYCDYTGCFVNNSTITNNTAVNGDGGGIYNNDQNFTISNSIIAKNTDQGGENPDCANSGFASNGYIIISGGHNLIGNVSSGCELTGDTASNITGVDPQLDPAGLADNGGPTQTVALLEGSPAIDAAGGNAEDVDQRGVARPDGAKDIGAFEYVAPPPTPTPAPVPPTPVVNGGGCNLGAAGAMGGGTLLGFLPFAGAFLVALRRRGK